MKYVHTLVVVCDIIAMWGIRVALRMGTGQAMPR